MVPSFTRLTTILGVLAVLGSGAPTTPAEQSPKPTVYTSAEKLIDDLPRDAYPEAGEGGRPERVVANKWLAQNVVGRQVEWTARVREISVQGNDPFTVGMTFSKITYIAYTDESKPNSGIWPSLAWGKPFKLGGLPCQALFMFARSVDQNEGIEAHVLWEDVPASAVKRFRALKGEKATFRAPITRAFFTGFSAGKGVKLVIGLGPATVNGFDPKAK
jgi:hypothetical protein